MYQSEKIKTEDIEKALHVLSKNDVGRNILQNCQNENFDISEIVLVSPDGKRNARCFRQADSNETKDIVSVNENLLQDDIFAGIQSQDEKCQMLANLLAHELTHAVQYGRNPDLIPLEKNNLQSEKNKFSLTDEAIMESLLEADCRAVQFVMALQNQSPVILKTLEKQHIPEKGMPILDKNKYTIWKLKHKSDDNTDIPKKQQAFREIFENILTSYATVYEKYIFPKYNVAQKIDFNGHENLIAGIYDEEKYGSPNQFANIIPNLSEENKTKLVASILQSKKISQKQHAINIAISKKAESIFPSGRKSSKIME